MQALFEEFLLPLVGALQNTPVPDIFVASGLSFILISIIGIFGHQFILRSRIKRAIICGFFFLLLGTFLQIGIPRFPLCTYSQIHGWDYILVLIAQKLSKTHIPIIFTVGSVVIIGFSTFGIIGSLQMRRSSEILGLVVGFLVLLPVSIFLFVEPALPINATTLGESHNIPFNGGKESIQTCQSYNGRITITISGTALTSTYDDVDAFYLYSKSLPRHFTSLTIWINGKPVDTFVHPVTSKIQPREDHTYKFVINVPKGKLTFGVGDGLAVNKEGSFTITVSQGTS